MRTMTEREYARLQAAWQECEDYIAATRVMRTRHMAMQKDAQTGSEYARGWLAALREWASVLGNIVARRNEP